MSVFHPETKVIGQIAAKLAKVGCGVWHLHQSGAVVSASRLSRSMSSQSFGLAAIHSRLTAQRAQKEEAERFYNQRAAIADFKHWLSVNFS